MDSREFNKSIITNLRLRGGNFESVAARLHFERLFSSNEILPNGIPPNVIVCIKQVRDPKPFSLQVNSASLRFAENWRENVSREIEKFYRKALRPIREFVPIEAESIIFADKSEMLACLASDFCDGKLIEKWWWKSLFPNLNEAKTAAEIWLDSIEFVPKSFQILAQKQKAVEFLLKLQESEVKEILIKLLHVFGLNKLHNAIFGLSEKVEIKTKNSEFEIKTNFEISKNEFDNFSTNSISFLNDILPEIEMNKLSFIRKNLIGISILLTKSPRFVRIEKFADQIRKIREFELNKRKPKTQTSLSVGFLKDKKENNLTEILEVEKEFNIKKTNIFSESEKVKSETKKDVEKPRKVIKTFGAIVNLSEQKNEFEENKEFPKLNPKSEKRPRFSLFEKSEKDEKISEIKSKTSDTKKKIPEKKQTRELKIPFSEDFSQSDEFIVFTRFGGIFYLLNLGLFLGLYRDFTENLSDEIDLNIWDFVLLLAFEFLGIEIEKDSVWQFLKEINGNLESIEHEFLPEKEWSISTDWLKTFQNERKWFWFEKDNRLIVRHPLNFSVIDVEKNEENENRFENRLENYRQFFDEIEKIEVFEYPKSTVFERWLKNLTDYVKVRLLQALNLETVEEINEILLKKTARISISATHLEIYFNLVDLPLSVRFSGLDRDPGWIPAVGKFVKFHFV